MPENSENESDALLHFTAEFSTRYVFTIVLRGLCFLNDVEDPCILFYGSISYVCVAGTENVIQCSSLVLWRQHLKRPSMAKPEM